MPLTDNQLSYRQYIASPVWKAKRQEALAFYGSVCNRCEEHGTDVHHKTYDRVGGQELMEDLEILCRPCHEAHHRAERATTPRKRHREPILRQAIFGYLNDNQKWKLIEDFGVSNANDLYARISYGTDPAIVTAAARMLGHNSFHDHSTRKIAQRKGIPQQKEQERLAKKYKRAEKLAKKLRSRRARQERRLQVSRGWKQSVPSSGIPISIQSVSNPSILNG